jgi:hypothetical protein
MTNDDVHVNGVKLYLWNAAINGPIIHPPGDIWAWGAMVEWYWQRKTEELGKKLSQCHFVHHKSRRYIVSLLEKRRKINDRPTIHHKSHTEYNGARTRSSAVGSRQLTAWAMTRPRRYASGTLLNVAHAVHKFYWSNSVKAVAWTILFRYLL